VDGPQTAFDIYNYYVPMLVVLATVPATMLLAWLAWLPGSRARRRCHPRARLIAVLGWISAIVWPLWIVAIIWAITGPKRSSRRPRLKVPVTPSRPPGAARTATIASRPSFPAERDKSVGKNVEVPSPRRRPSFSSIP